MALDPALQDSQIVDLDYDPHPQSAHFDTHFGNDDAVMSDGNRDIEVDENARDSGHVDAQAVVEETQFVNLEKDTQAPDIIVFQTSANTSTSVVSKAQTFTPFVRPDTDPLEDIPSSFKFAAAKKHTAGQFTYIPGQKKPPAVVSASGDNPPAQPAPTPLDQPPAPSPAATIAPTPSKVNVVAPVPTGSVNVQTPAITQRSNVLHNASTTSGQTSNISTSSSTKIFAAQPPAAKPASEVPGNTAAPSHKQKPASTIRSHTRTDATTKRGPAHSSMKPSQPAPDPQPSENITAVPTNITGSGTTFQTPVSKSLPKSSGRALPEQPMTQKLPVDPQETPKRGPVHPQAPAEGKRVPQSAPKTTGRKKSLVQEGNFRIPQTHRASPTLARPFPEVQGKTTPFKQTGSRQMQDEIQQVCPPENQTISADSQCGLEKPRNSEARPITPVHPAYDASFTQPVHRAGAQSPAMSETSQRSNVSARMKRHTPVPQQEPAPQVSRPMMKRNTPASLQEPKPQVLRPIHNAKISKPMSKPVVTSAPSIKMQTTKAVSASPKLNNVPIPSAAEQVVDVMPLELPNRPNAFVAEKVPVALAAERVTRDVPSEPKKVRPKSNTLNDWAWRENLSRIYEEKISSLETKLEEKEEEIKSIEERLKEQEKQIQSTDEALQSSKEELQSKDKQLQSRHKDLLSIRKAEEAATNRIEDLEAEKVETVRKVRKWERLRETYAEHMNKVVDHQNVLKAAAVEIKASKQENEATASKNDEAARINQEAANKNEEAANKNKAAAEKITNALDELRSAKAELRTLADAEKAAAEAKKTLEQVTGEKNAIKEELEAVKQANANHAQTIESQREDMDKYLLAAQQERSKAEKFQKQLNGEKEAHTKFISTLENLPQKVTMELSKENGPLAELLSSETSLQNKFDEATKILNELKTHEIQPSSPLVKKIENLFAQIPQPPSPSQDGIASTEQVVSKLAADFEASLSGFVGDVQKQTKLEAQVSELQQKNNSLSATENSAKQEKEKLAGDLEDSRRHLNDCRSQLESKTQELEAAQALPREDPRLVAKIEVLEGTNSSLRGQLQELTRLQKENLSLQGTVGEYESRCSRHEKEKQELRNSFTAEKKKDNEIAEKVRKESTFQSDRKIKSLKQTLKEVEAELDQLKSKSTTQLEDNKKLHEEEERRRKSYESSRAKAQKHTNELAAENEMLHNHVSDVKAELAKSVKLTQAATEKEALQNQIADLKAELAKSVKLTQVATEKQVLQNQIADLKAELAKSMKLAQVATEKQVLQNQIADLKAELAKSVKPAQVAAEKEAFLKQISELQADAAMREDDAVLRPHLSQKMDTPRNMLRKNSQKHFTRQRKIRETQFEEDIEDSQDNSPMPLANLREPSLPPKRRPSGRLGLPRAASTSILGNATNSQGSNATLKSVPDSEPRPQEPTGIRYQEADIESLGSGRGASQASRTLLSSQPVQSTPLKPFSAMDSGHWSANSALTDVDEFDGDYEQLGTVYEKARAKKASESASSTMVEPTPSDYQPTPTSRQFSNPDEELEKLQAQNIASRAPARRQPSHRKTSASALKSALKPSSTSYGPREINMGAPLDQPITHTPPKNPYNRVASGSTSNRHQVPKMSPIHNGGVSRRNGAFKGLGTKRKAESELVSPKAPKAPKAMMTRTLSNNRSKMPPPPLAPARRTSNRSSSIAAPEPALFSASPRVSLPPPTATPKARNPVRR